MDTFESVFFVYVNIKLYIYIFSVIYIYIYYMCRQMTTKHKFGAVCPESMQQLASRDFKAVLLIPNRMLLKHNFNIFNVLGTVQVLKHMCEFHRAITDIK